MNTQDPETKTKQGQVLTPDFSERLRVYNLSPEELEIRLGLVGKFFMSLEPADNVVVEPMTEEEQDYLLEIGWIESDDYEVIKEDPRIKAVEKDLKQNRSTVIEDQLRNKSRLMEWQVVLEGLAKAGKREPAA